MASSKFSTKSRVCYYRGDINEIFLCCRYQKVAKRDRGEIFLSSLCQKVALGVDKHDDDPHILDPILAIFLVS